MENDIWNKWKDGEMVLQSFGDWWALFLNGAARRFITFHVYCYIISISMQVLDEPLQAYP